jgi:hypothetical protein
MGPSLVANLSSHAPAHSPRSISDDTPGRFAARAATGHAAAPPSSVMNSRRLLIRHLVGEREQLGRHAKVECRRGLELGFPAIDVPRQWSRTKPTGSSVADCKMTSTS